MNDKTILYPLRINSTSPIQTIHRYVGLHLQDEFEFIALVGAQYEEVENLLSTGIIIDSEWPKYKKLLKLLQLYSTSYDIVHTGASGLKTHPYFLRLISSLDVKHIHTHHTTTPNYYNRQKQLSENADVVTSVSEFVADWARSEFRTSEVSIIPNGVDTAIFHPESYQTEEDRILYVGRLTERKHPKLVINIAKQCEEMDFLIRGDGPMLEKLEPIAPSNVTFLGRLSVDQMAEEYARASATLCPFEKEGFGMVVIESMAAGTPVIGLESGNLPSLITPQSGVLCESLNLNEWVKTIKHVCDSKDEFSPRQRISEYRWPMISEKYRKVYNNI